MKDFFGILLKPLPWLNMVYNLISFPLGIFYFTFLITWILLGFGLLIIWIGLFLLLAIGFLWWYFAAFERLVAQLFCQVNIPEMKRPGEHPSSAWEKFKNHISHPVTWKSLAFLFLKFPLGIFQFIITIVLIAVATSLISIPFLYRFTTVDLVLFEVNTLPLAILLSLMGLFLVFPMLHIFNFMGMLLGQLASAMLGDHAPAQPHTYKKN